MDNKIVTHKTHTLHFIVYDFFFNMTNTEEK
jgi:hypothetical protein